MWELESWTEKEYEDFIVQLKEMEDTEYRSFHSSLLPGIDHLIGIRTPKMREIAKQICKGNYEDLLYQSNKHFIQGKVYYEQSVIEGMVIGYCTNTKKATIYQTKQYISDFAPKIDNWATCDIFCAGMKAIQKKPEEYWNFILQYVDDCAEFKVRMGIVLLMDYYLIEEYIDRVLLICDRVKQEDYYVNMAIAWLISVAYVKFQDKTMDYLKNNNLSKFTYNKALQKIVESNRVSKEEKEVIRTMKRN